MDRRDGAPAAREGRRSDTVFDVQRGLTILLGVPRLPDRLGSFASGNPFAEFIKHRLSALIVDGGVV